jgi:LuxR family maltose regulon positive regulatory protein
MYNYYESTSAESVMGTESRSIPKPTKILLVDDHQLFRKGLRLILEEEKDLSIVGEAGDGQEAIEKFLELSPDVVVMDITMPTLNGIEATKQILAKSPNTKVVALSIHSGRQFVQDALSAGAVGYILKDSVPDELTETIRKVLGGEVFLSDAITGVVVSEYVNLLSGNREIDQAPTNSQAVSAAVPLPLHKTKLYRPPNPGYLVHRQRLIDKLNLSVSLPLTVITAPAGYGKSTLVSQWLEENEVQGSWLSLDDSDNDPRQFYAYLLCALRELFPNNFHASESLLKMDNLPSSNNIALQLITEINTTNQRFILVLDDYHVIQSKAVHELLDELVKHPPGAMHLVLLSRIDPPLPMATLRAKGMMVEIRVKDLCFTNSETAKYLKKILNIPVEERIVSILVEKSEGWVTGLRLATLSLRQADDMERIVAGLQKTNRYIWDYFVEEILSQQTATMQDYLLVTSVFDRFCAPLCDAVAVFDCSQKGSKLNGLEFLQLLNKANLFVIRLDDEDQWFRYHHLFKNLLNRRIKNRFKSEEVRVFHIRASSWFAETGHFEEAIQHALKGGDVEKAADIVGRARHDLMNRDQLHRLERWLEFFPHEVTQQHLHLVLLRCWLDLWHWYRLDKLVPDLASADALLANSTLEMSEMVVLKAEVAAMRCVFSYWILEPSQGVMLADQAFRDSPDEHECTRSTAVFGWGPLYQMLGEAKQGEQLLWSHIANEQFKHPSSQARIIVSLGMALWPEAETRKLKQVTSRLLQLSQEYELSWSHSFARYFFGLIHYERNELSEAVTHLGIVAGDPQRFPIQNVTHCSFLLSLSYQALGLPSKARKVAESITEYTFERGNQMFTGLAEAFQADLDLRQGRIPQANQWCNTYVAPASHGMQRFFNAELTAIKVMLALSTRESLESAAEQLEAMHKLLGEIHQRRLMIDVLGMQALLADAQKQKTHAFDKLSEALSLAEPSRLIRPFLDLGQSMADLLKRLTEQGTVHKYAEQILEAFREEKTDMLSDASVDHIVDQQSLSNQALDDPLTEREIEILTILTKKVSNPEIAEKLFISPETVKRHLYNIYQKLGVENRRQAITKAKSLGIL